MTSPHTPIKKNKSLQRGTYSLSYHWIYKLPSGILFSVFSTIIVSLLLIKTNPSPHALNPTPFYLFKDFISLLRLESLLYWIIPLYANKLLFPLFKKQSKQTEKQNSLDTLHPLSANSFLFHIKLVYNSCLYWHLSFSPPPILVSVPTIPPRLLLSKSPVTSMLSNPMDIFYLYSVQPLSSFHWVNQSLFLETFLSQLA